MMQFDLIIIGGGLVGATLACALQKSDLRIALIDASVAFAPDEERYIGLNDSSICLLENIGLWSRLAPHATPIKQVHVSHRGHFGKVEIRAEECGINSLGQVLPASDILNALYAVLHESRQVKLCKPVSVQGVKQNAEEMILELSTSAKYSARFIVVADGSRSKVRKLLEIPVEEIDYQQTALVTTTELKRSHYNIAYERFLTKGAIAMLPLPGNRAATIWTAPTRTVEQLMGLTETEFLMELQANIGYRQGKFIGITKRSLFPLQRMQALQPQNSRVLLMGNAAHTLHPIAAQGLNLSLYEIAILVENLLQPVPIFSLKNDKLLRQQYFSKQLSHQLQEVFSQDFFLFNMLRQLGMVGLESCMSAKKYFAQAALGRAGYVPSLLLREK